MPLISMPLKKQKDSGFILVSTLLVTALLLSFLAVYYSTTSHEITSMRFSKNTTSGFYAAEAGLNLRAEEIRGIFLGYNRPTGISPQALGACSAGNNGSGSYQCVDYAINNRNVTTYLTEDAANPVKLTIPPGELYQNLNAQEYRYVTKSFAKNKLSQLEANLELHFRTRLVPLFQFAAFYDKDLEILPGPSMTLSGPVHTNGDLYLNSLNSLTIDGQVTTSRDLWRGRKDGPGACDSKPVQVKKSSGTFASILPSCSSRMKVPKTTLDTWGGAIRTNVLKVVVPAPEALDPVAGGVYWNKSDLRIVLVMTAADSVSEIQVQSTSGSNISGHTTSLLACPGVAGGVSKALPGTKAVATRVMKNFRENKDIQLLDIDMLGLFNCLKTTNWFGTSKSLADTTEDGLVFHFTVKGPNSNSAANKYGIRLRNGDKLWSSVAGAPTIKGVTVVTNQAAYIFGNYNSVNKIPAAVLSDSLNILSNNWSDANASNSNVNTRIASNTTVNAALLSGTDSTGNVEGTGGQGGVYNGGLENYPRFHENWSGYTLLYRGSFVSLNDSRHVAGLWGAQSYSPPNRDWNYDVSFNNASNLPPLTPRFVYLKQELFVRDFNQIK
jgi:hypothetical protein